MPPYWSVRKLINSVGHKAQNRETIKFIIQHETLLRVKGSVIQDYAGTTGIITRPQACPQKNVKGTEVK